MESRTCKIQKMVDRISNLPDPILCHILSFLPTKEAVATSLVSKRWKPLWRSVPALDIDYNDNSENGENYYRLVRFVYAFILSRDLYHPIQRFRLWFFSYISSIYDAGLTNVKIWVEAAVQRGVEHLDFRCVDIETTSLSAIFCCKTLVVLKLMDTDVKVFSSVDLPSLKVMHLKFVSFLEVEYLAELLSGCPQLEDLKAINLEFDNNFTEREFKTLPKLVRADISWVHYFLLRVVSNVECLHINGMFGLYRLEVFDIVKKLCCKDSSAVFHNLTYIQFNTMNHKKDWVAAVEVLKYCPKLRVLVINKLDGHSIWGDEEEREDWLCPQSDVECIPLHLKSCTLYNYKGSKTEFQFARYIMQNARFLQTIKIHCVTDSPWKKFSMIQELSLCTRRCATCELSFE